jgi:hypothetical protein
MGYPDSYPGPDGKMIDNRDPTMRRLERILDRMGFEIEWSDAGTGCSGCGSWISTQPDCYGWQPDYHGTDGEILCRDCLDKDELIEDKLRTVRWMRECLRPLMGRLPALNTVLIGAKDLLERGWTRYNPGSPDDPEWVRAYEFEVGWHPGQDDTPEKVLPRALAGWSDRDKVLLRISAVGPFDSRWEVWFKRQDESEDRQ